MPRIEIDFDRDYGSCDAKLHETHLSIRCHLAPNHPGDHIHYPTHDGGPTVPYTWENRETHKPVNRVNIQVLVNGVLKYTVSPVTIIGDNELTLPLPIFPGNTYHPSDRIDLRISPWKAVDF